MIVGTYGVSNKRNKITNYLKYFAFKNILSV